MLSNDDWTTQVYAKYREWKGWGAKPLDSVDRRLYDIELARAGVSPPARILEIGYGDGAFLLYATELGYACAGVELLDSEVERLRSLGIDARVGSIDGFLDGEFDLIAAFDVFEHMLPDQILATLRVANRKLRAGGRLIARFPNAVSPFGAITQYGDITHRSQLSGESFGQLAFVAGLLTVGTFNAAWTWRGRTIAKTVLKPLAVIARRAIELICAFVYYGRRVPMDPEITVVLAAQK